MSSLPFHDLDDNEFQIALVEFANGGSIRYDPDRLASLKFNPLLCESYKNFSLCKISIQIQISLMRSVAVNIIQKTALTICCLRNKIV